MDNPVYLDEDIPFVESGDYEIDEATGGGNGSSTTLTHGNIMSLNHQGHHFDDDPMWSTTIPLKRGRRPKSAAVVITTTSSNQKPEPKRRGRKPKQDPFSTKGSLSLANQTLNDNLLSETTDDITQKQQRRTNAGAKSNKKLKVDEQQLAGKKILRVDSKLSTRLSPRLQAMLIHVQSVLLKLPTSKILNPSLRIPPSINCRYRAVCPIRSIWVRQGILSSWVVIAKRQTAKE